MGLGRANEHKLKHIMQMSKTWFKIQTERMQTSEQSTNENNKHKQKT